jgi:hypothetical protein
MRSLQDAADSADDVISNALRKVGVGSRVGPEGGARTPPLTPGGYPARHGHGLPLTLPPAPGFPAPPPATAGKCVRIYPCPQHGQKTSCIACTKFMIGGKNRWLLHPIYPSTSFENWTYSYPQILWISMWIKSFFLTNSQ